MHVLCGGEQQTSTLHSKGCLPGCSVSVADKGTFISEPNKASLEISGRTLLNLTSWAFDTLCTREQLEQLQQQLSFQLPFFTCIACYFCNCMLHISVKLQPEDSDVGTSSFFSAS